MPQIDASGDRVWINNAGTYSVIRGTSNLSRPSSRQAMDISTKDIWPYDASLPGAISETISFDIKPDLPDAVFTRLETLYKNGTTELFQIRQNGAAGNGTTDVQYQCLMAITAFNKTMNRGEVRRVDVTLTPAAAPTIDNYRPTA